MITLYLIALYLIGGIFLVDILITAFGGLSESKLKTIIRKLNLFGLKTIIALMAIGFVNLILEELLIANSIREILNILLLGLTLVVMAIYTFSDLFQK